MSVVRLNITLPEDLARKLDEIVKTKEKSRFIAETLRQRIERIQHEQLQKALEEGLEDCGGILAPIQGIYQGPHQPKVSPNFIPFFSS